MIDYKRVQRGAKGVEKPTPEQETIETLKNTIEVQKAEIRRLQRLLGMGILRGKL